MHVKRGNIHACKNYFIKYKYVYILSIHYVNCPYALNGKIWLNKSLVALNLAISILCILVCHKV